MLPCDVSVWHHIVELVYGIGKDCDAGRDWGHEEKGTTEDEMAGWHHWLDGCESEWTPGDGDGQGGLACCDSWGHSQTRLSDWIELNWTEWVYCFPGGSGGTESACNVGDSGSIPGSGRSPGEGNGNHSSILSRRIPWTEEPSRLQSMGSQRVAPDWATNTFHLTCFMPTVGAPVW